jgi:hypothetical protein
MRQDLQLSPFSHSFFFLLLPFFTLTFDCRSILKCGIDLHIQNVLVNVLSQSTARLGGDVAAAAANDVASFAKTAAEISKALRELSKNGGGPTDRIGVIAWGDGQRLLPKVASTFLFYFIFFFFPCIDVGSLLLLEF